MRADLRNLEFTPCIVDDNMAAGDLVETYKLLNGYYNVDWTKFFSLSPVQSTIEVIK